MSTIPRPAQVEDASSDSEAQGPLRTYQGGLRLNNAHQSVVAQTLNNSQSVNFVSNGASANSEAPAQSIYASTVDIQGGVTYRTEQHFHGSKDNTVPEWLHNLSLTRFAEKHHENTQISRKAPGTGKWLLDSPEFLSWRDDDLRILWCYGIPGAGKTILASIIINDIQSWSRSSGNRVACIYVYFDYKNQKLQDVPNLLSSLLAQLVQQGSLITNETKAVYRAWKDEGAYPSVDDLLLMLMSQIEAFSKVFIVVDALDECLNDQETNIADDFLRALHQLPRSAHLLFTSRNEISIKSMVQADRKLEIHADSNDLRRYLESRIQSRKHLKIMIDKEAEKDNSFLDKALNAIVERSRGMFLLAQLHMDFLTSRSSLEDFKNGILHLPRDPDAVYKAALERISAQEEFKRNLAINVLTWLVFAVRPLTVSELKHALCLRVTDKTLPEDRFVTEETWTSACAGIVVIDQATQIVRLAHYTAEEYLTKNKATIFQHEHSKIAEICLAYLLLDDFRQVLVLPNETPAQREKYPLYGYAADHWGDHVAHGVRGSVYKQAWEFLSDGEKVMNAFQVMSHDRFRFEVNVTGLHVAAYFGLDKLAKKLLHKGFEMNATTQEGETALHWAAYYGQRQFLKLLIDQGADLNIKDSKGRTALHKAVVKEDAASVEMLLSSSRQINLNLEDAQKWSPLRWAAAYGQAAIVELLLKSGADIDARDRDGSTALQWSALQGHSRVVELLIRKGANVETRCSDQWTLLEWAAREGRERFLRLLIEKHMNLDATNKDGWTALRWAVEYGHATVAWLLMRAQADINKPDNTGWTPLHSAVDKWAESRDKTLIWLLIENGANPNARTELGLSVLHLAVSKWYNSLVWLLLEKGANPRQADNKGCTPLHLAAETWDQTRDMSPFWLLFEKGVDINTPTKLGLTMLHIAASRGHSPVVAMLLERGANPKQGDNNNRTPLHWAVFEGHQPVAWLLIQKEKRLIHAIDDERRTALHVAATAGSLPTAKLLLEHGADLNILDREGNTPLHCAVSHSHQQMVAFLVQSSADADIPNKKGWVPLHSAACEGKKKIIKTLLKVKPDTMVKNKEGQTPWELARDCGYDLKKF